MYCRINLTGTVSTCYTASFANSNTVTMTVTGSCPSTTITSSNICPTKATISWTGGGPNYKVYWQETSPVSSIVHTHSVTGANTYTFNIFSQATYNVWVKTYCGGSNYSAASPVFQINPVTFLPPPTGLSITSSTCNGFTASWNAVTGANAYILKYTLTGGSTFTRTTTNLSKVFVNLPTNASYTVSVASVIICNGVSTNCTYSSTVPAYTLACREGDIATIDPKLSDVVIYPSPSSGNFSINFENSVAQSVSYSISNMLGQVVYSTIENENEGTVNRSFDLAFAPAGIYSVTIKTAVGIVTKQVMIAK